VGEQDLFLLAVGEPARGLGAQAEDGADRRRRSAARAQLQHLLEEDERDDHGRCLEVHGRRAVVAHAVGQRVRYERIRRGAGASAGDARAASTCCVRMEASTPAAPRTIVRMGMPAACHRFTVGDRHQMIAAEC
jgi:hypothetical protein